MENKNRVCNMTNEELFNLTEEELFNLTNEEKISIIIRLSLTVSDKYRLTVEEMYEHAPDEYKKYIDEYAEARGMTREEVCQLMYNTSLARVDPEFREQLFQRQLHQDIPEQEM